MLSIQELRSSTQKELFQELDKARKEMVKIRINTNTKQEKDTSKVQKMKCYIAQIHTALNETEKEKKKEKSSPAPVADEPEKPEQEQKK